MSAWYYTEWTLTGPLPLGCDAPSSGLGADWPWIPEGAPDWCPVMVASMVHDIMILEVMRSAFFVQQEVCSFQHLRLPIPAPVHGLGRALSSS